MKELFIFAVVALIIGLAMTGAVVAHQREKKRTAAMQALAESMGLPFFPISDSSLVAILSKFHLFSQGGGKSIGNMIHGDTEDVDMAIFDYSFTTGAGKHRHTHRQTVLYFDSTLLVLPDFAVRPEGFFHKLGKIVGLKDIDIESHPKFSSMFWLQGSNEAAIRKLFRPEVLSWFEGKADISAEGNGTRLIIYRADKRVDSDQVRGFMEEAFEIYGRLRSNTETESSPTSP